MIQNDSQYMSKLLKNKIKLDKNALKVKKKKVNLQIYTYITLVLYFLLH